MRAGEDARFFLGKVRAFQIALGGALGAVLLHGFFPFRRGDGVHQRVFRGKDHVGGAEEGVRPRGVNGDGFPAQLKVHFRPFRLAYPVALEQLDGFRPVQGLQFVNQAFGIVRDAQHPLAQGAAFHVVALGFPFLHFLIGEHGAQVRGPVHGHFRHVGQAPLVDFLAGETLGLQFGDGARLFQFPVVVGVVKTEKDPLGPAHVFVVRRGDFPVPVIGKAQHLELAAEVVNVPEGGDGRMLPGLDGVLLRRKAEGVPAHGVKHVEAVHALEARHNVRGGVPFRMSHMEARAAGIGEHVQHVALGPGSVKSLIPGVACLESLPFVPDLLPFGLKDVKRIWFLALGHDAEECILRPGGDQV